MDKSIIEELEINNFLSIEHIKWRFEGFNIITGDMGAGKSICIKLVQFFESIIPNFLIIPYEDFIDRLEDNNSFDFLKKEFNDKFVLIASNLQKLPPFKITYTFSYKDERFETVVSGDESNINFSSSFLEKLFVEWREVLQKKISVSPENLSPDGFKEVKLSLYNDLLKRFNNYFPIATTFVPASRAALAFNSNHTDDYLKQYKELVDVLPRYKSRNQEIINTILKAKIEIDDSLYLESDDGRKVPIAKASSGQQEIVYVLLLLDKLGNFQYIYGKHHSIFIEEPSAHLFPLEQKQTIELIVQRYNELKGNGNPVRFFITTHSPYVLNSLNNILKKDALLRKYKDHTDQINNAVKIPSLNADEISAYFIDNNGNWENMMDESKKYLFSDKIADISKMINDDTSKLHELDAEFS